MATITMVLEKADRDKGPMTPERRARLLMARDVKRLYLQHRDSWIYFYSPGDTVSPVGDVGDFDEVRITS